MVWRTPIPPLLLAAESFVGRTTDPRLDVSMLAGVGVVCFAASYGVALALEVTRLFFRSGVRGAVMVGFAGAGLLAHAIYLFNRAVAAAGPPLSSQRDWCFSAALVVVVVYLFLLWFHPRTAFGLLLLPSALALIAVGVWLADPAPIAREPAGRVWAAVHGAALGGGAVAVVFGFITGAMYLAQVRRLKQRRTAFERLKLPSLEWLQQANVRATVAATMLLALGVAAGWLLNVIRQGGPLPWTDPLIVATMAMLGWLLAALALAGSGKRLTAGRRVAFATIISFLFLVVVVAALVSGLSEHGVHRAPAENRANELLEGPGGAAAGARR